MEESITCKAGWELYKSCTAEDTEKFLEKSSIEPISSSLEDKKKHLNFSGNSETRSQGQPSTT